MIQSTKSWPETWCTILVWGPGKAVVGICVLLGVWLCWAGLAHQVLLLRRPSSVSYLSHRCHACLMSQFWSTDIPAAIWEGSGPKNI